MISTLVCRWSLCNAMPAVCPAGSPACLVRRAACTCSVMSSSRGIFFPLFLTASIDIWLGTKTCHCCDAFLCASALCARLMQVIPMCKKHSKKPQCTNLKALYLVYLSISPAVLMYSTKTKPPSFQKRVGGVKKKKRGGVECKKCRALGWQNGRWVAEACSACRIICHSSKGRQSCGVLKFAVLRNPPASLLLKNTWLSSRDDKHRQNTEEASGIA